MQPPRIRVRASSSPTPRHTSQMSLPTFDYLLPSFLSFRIRSHSRILRVAHLSSPPSFPGVPPVNAPLQSAPFGFTLSFLHPSLPSPARESGLKKRKRKTAESAPRTGFPRDTNTHDTPLPGVAEITLRGLNFRAEDKRTGIFLNRYRIIW